jgi:hypothetical protein
MTVWWRWLALTTAGEVLGFAVPAVTGALTATYGVAGWRQAAALIVAGAAEGAALGMAQAVVLRRVVAGMNRSSWVLATALGAMLAYAMGMLPSALFPLALPAMVVIGAVAGSVLLGSIGMAQWLVLRRYRPRSASWIAVTACAWLLGLVVFFAIATPLWQPGQSVVLVAAIGLVAGLAMAVTVAAVTGWAVVRLGTGHTSTGDFRPSSPGPRRQYRDGIRQ